jgi:hypothetical protein
MIATHTVPIVIALGIVFDGFLTLSAGAVAHSTPINPQNVSNAVFERVVNKSLL